LLNAVAINTLQVSEISDSRSYNRIEATPEMSAAGKDLIAACWREFTDRTGPAAWLKGIDCRTFNAITLRPYLRCAS
jgi:hypothetical protein